MNNRKLTKLLLTLILLGILTLLIISQNLKLLASGTIEKIEILEKQIKINLKGEDRSIVLFETSPIQISVGQKIEIYGKEGMYRNKKQIIVDKIKLLS